MKRRVLHKLLGGPLHGQRRQIPSERYLRFTKLSPASFVSPAQYGYPQAETSSFHYQCHQAKIGDNILDFYAISTKTGEEAFEMLCNHLLRDTEILSEENV